MCKLTVNRYIIKYIEKPDLYPSTTLPGTLTSLANPTTNVSKIVPMPSKLPSEKNGEQRESVLTDMQ